MPSVTNRLKRSLTPAFLAVRGVAFRGSTYQCPCCQARLRSFTVQRGTVQTSQDGYCPRCNAKARHRRNWLFMEEHGLLSGPAAILEIAPWWSFARRLSRIPGIRYTSVDLDGSSAIVTHVGDITELPFDDRSMDAVICIHVLEHVEDDARAMSELHRVLRPGGWALVTVPINRNTPTDEDPLITDPEERKQRFGERSHVRMYGLDIVQRLATAGFEVTVHDPTEVDATERRLHGLKTDEFVFLCTRPVADPVGDPA